MQNFNARFGRDDATGSSVIGRLGEAMQNGNDKKLQDICAGDVLSISNTFFQHKDIE